MKNLIRGLATAAVLSLSANAFAAPVYGGGGGNDIFDIDLVAVDSSGIWQMQHGHELHQDALLGVVAKDYTGTGIIFVKGSHIVQKQWGNHNKQTARVGVIGCDCGDHHKRPRPRGPKGGYGSIAN